MAKLRFEIEGQPSYVAFSTYLAATSRLLQLLREIDQVVSGRYGGSLQWYVSGLDSGKNLAIEVISKVKRVKKSVLQPPDFGGQVAGSLVTGFDNIQNYGSSPPYLSEFGLQRLGAMLDVLNKNGASSYKAIDVDQHREVEVSSAAAQTIQQLLPIRRSAIGSVEGRLEAISIHRGPKVVVYHALTKKAITCVFQQSDVMLETVRDILGKRVLVSGTVHWNIKSEPVRVDVEDVRILGERQLPSTKDLSGRYPDITDGMTTDEYIRSLRDDD